MKSPESLCLLFFLAACASPDMPSGSDRQQPPNIVIFLADDQGWGDLAFNGNESVATPHLDRMASEGARFEHFFVQPVCSPTRAEMLTGRYHPRSGVSATSSGMERLDLDETTMADVFSAAGYATGVFGKWHNGTQAPYHPNARGFDEFYGFASGHWGDYFGPPLEHNGVIVEGEGYVVDDFTTRAMAFMERNRETPFLVYLPYNIPHSPMQVPDEYWDRFADTPLAQHHREPEREDRDHTRAALAMTENIDWNVGRVLEKLGQLGISDDTIVLYFSDNGPNGARWNGGMKGWKGSVNEGGVRSALIMQWPGVIPAGTVVKDLAAAIDLLPTLVELAGINAAYGMPLDGVSVAPAVTGVPYAADERFIVNHWRGRTSIRSARHRLDTNGQLFDMVADPGQQNDVAGINPDALSALEEAKALWQADVLAEAEEEDRRPFTVGHPDFVITHLPARDAKAHGGIERSNRYPNDSFFSNWTSTADSITWNVQVMASGEFSSEIYYTCRKGDEGAQVELSFAGQRAVAAVPAVHDPPLRGMADDRTPRIESYVKDFATMDLGTITMAEGIGTLSLRAQEIPGEAVMDFKLLVLRRLD